MSKLKFMEAVMNKSSKYWCLYISSQHSGCQDTVKTISYRENDAAYVRKVGRVEYKTENTLTNHASYEMHKHKSILLT